jgi:TonB family protein
MGNSYLRYRNVMNMCMTSAALIVALLSSCSGRSEPGLASLPGIVACGATAVAVHPPAGLSEADARAFLSFAEFGSPQFRSATTPPELNNPDAVARELQRTYPLDLRDSGIGGDAVYLLLINPDGVPLRVRLLRSSSEPKLDDVGARVLRVARFKPAVAGNCRITYLTTMPVRWRSR